MRNTFMLTFANLRRHKGQTFSLFLIILIAALLLNIGLVLLFNVEKFFYERAEANHAPHYTVMYVNGFDLIEQGLKYIENDPRVLETEKINLIGGYGNYYMGDTSNNGNLFLSKVEKTQKMDPPNLIGEYRSLTGDAIYMPYFMFLSGGFKVGDTFKITLAGEDFDFTVAGTTEEITMGAQFNTIYRFYISDEKYDEIEKKLPESGFFTLLMTRFENKEESVFFQTDYNKAVSTEGIAFDFNYTGAGMARTTVPMITSAIVTAFSVILLIVSLIVIRFRIGNSIEENMTNIGAQKAIGYKSIQIVSAMVIQFCGTALVGSIAGIALSQIIVPLIMEVLKPIIALAGGLRFDIVSAFVTLLFILLTVWLISFISARKIKNLHPLIALRGGITTHSFRKNALPLDKARGNLNVLLALKQLLQKKRQSVAIGIIVAAVTMASIAGTAVNYTMNENRDDFARTIFGEIPDASFMLKNSEDGEAFKEKLLGHSEVRKAYGYQVGSAMLLIDEVSITTVAVEDCSLLESKMLIQGRYPKHDNEISLGPVILKVVEKKIGDTVIVKSGDNEKEYIITGIVQFMNNGGFLGIITGEGLYRVQPDFRFTDYNIYLNDGIDTKEFIKKVENENGEIINSVFDVQDNLMTTMSMMSGIFAMVSAGIVLVTVFIVILTLYMVIKTTILRRKRELGIQKALGFTTFQLMNQIALNMLPVMIIGVAVGAVAGFFGVNPMMVMLLSFMGIIQFDLPVPLGQTVIICAALVLLAYAVSMLIARRIRKISAYALVSE